MVSSSGLSVVSFHPALRGVAAAVLASGWLSLAQAQSLVQLTEQAQTYDAAWQSARAQLDATISKGAQAKASLLPRIGIQAGSQYSETRVRSDFPAARLDARQDSASLQAQQPLYNPANLVTYRQGQRSVDLAYAQVDAAAQNLLVRAAQAYFQVLTAQDTLQLVQAQKRAVSEQLAFAQRNFEIGTATVTDSREAQARFDLVRAQEIAADNQLRVNQAALEQLVGVAGASPWPLAQPVRLPTLVPADLASWLALAADHSPLVRQAQIALDVAQLETDKAQAGHKPTVDLQASYGTQRNPDGTAAMPYRNNATVGTVGVVMNIPLFAGFAVQNRVKETLSLEEKARADLEEARRQVAQAVRTAYFGVQSATGQVQALEAAVASSQSALEANKLGYEVGVRINIDVLNAQSQLYQSQKDLAQARYNLLVGHLQLRQAAGNLDMQDVHAINQLLSPALQTADATATSSAR
ncbi:TolC family outer membrane protein [Comamonas aquatica]|jgi:outer membrane protein|uniref:Outer membrane protein tolC n=1 Tax=Comamonas aquatica TaxID=225991 RepID=A0AA35DA73_9BURK|nr:TolC family outer membrane protein [Comamonas aquatica]CAB5650561.1 Outer membrane protein tolC precursor [Comamonas aquatica]CAB5707078.1 Outer membrane protein tolC precursor [Comamonas aquatica]CAC9218762.1 Outer membrane protein tolC precursor [Comamonas aquatica]CAC9684481.1 Outer membrane protein tolC precursor [Comamonas aquatica]